MKDNKLNKKHIEEIQNFAIDKGMVIDNISDNMFVVYNEGLFSNIDKILTYYMGKDNFMLYTTIIHDGEDSLNELRKLAKINYYKRQITELENDILQ